MANDNKDKGSGNRDSERRQGGSGQHGGQQGGKPGSGRSGDDDDKRTSTGR
jgi:hypothetical protein